MDEDGIWRTIGGRRVFIKNVQSLSDAMIESGKFKNKYRKYYTKKLRSIVFEKYVRTKREDMYVKVEEDKFIRLIEKYLDRIEDDED